jgi:hypothetical protein
MGLRMVANGSVQKRKPPTVRIDLAQRLKERSTASRPTPLYSSDRVVGHNERGVSYEPGEELHIGESPVILCLGSGVEILK